MFFLPRVSAVFNGVPTFFRACCREASYGGPFGYDHPGHELMRHVRNLVPYEIEDAEWESECDALDEHCEQENCTAILDWFVAHYPRCMALVPVRRRQAFVRGVLSMCGENQGWEQS